MKKLQKLPKPEELPKDILNPETLQNLLLDTTLPFRETRSSSINQNTGTSSPNQEIITGHYPTPSPGEDSTTKKKYDLENIFFFLINHTVYSPYIFLPSH